MGRMKFTRKKERKFLRAFLIYLGILLATAGIIYYIFFIPSAINNGIVVDRKETSKSINLKLAYDDNTKWVSISKKIPLPYGIAYNVTLKGYRVQSITPCSTYSGLLLSRDNKEIELDTRILTPDKNISYVRVENGKLIKLPQSSAVIGTSNHTYIGDSSGKISTVLVGPLEIKDLWVGISNADFSGLNHQSMTFTSKKSFMVEAKDISYKVLRGDILNISFKNGSASLDIFTNKNDAAVLKASIGSTRNRIKIYPILADYPITVPTLKRSNGYIPAYYGSFDVFIRNDSLRLINIVNADNYLKYVVPSEMLGSGGLEGYKVQAVAARTYAFSDMLAGRFSAYGFHVDDTTQSQVYNAQPSNPICDQAIDETAGQIMTYEGKVIDAKYHSTSHGLSAPFNEVYIGNTDGKNPEPYLTFKDFTESGVKDISDEESASSFLKDWTIKSYDSNSPYFRWKFTVDRKTLENNINTRIYERYVKSPSDFKRKTYFNYYKKAQIPEEGIGKITDIFISKRGKAGNVMEMTIISDTGTYRITGELNIKRLVAPEKFQLTPLYGKAMEKTSMPSPYFVIDKEIQGNSLKGITVYGGGYGHSVGMSQYGVIGLVRQGKTYEDILHIFYKDIEFKNYMDVIQYHF